ncbi:MAG: transposase, partial [Deltaproteobacteria bacterium]|nr:transposase [Deltaproteobacteria bacterium]
MTVRRKVARLFERGLLADDRHGLERLLRYILRPAFSQERLSLTTDGRVRYKLRRPWPNGATHLEMEPVAFLRRL